MVFGLTLLTMRIVSGIAKGRKLLTPLSQDVRPSKDRVREAIFNSLTSFELIDGRHFIDLFAGSGALGLEALSRGARKVTFVDNQKACIDVIETNVGALGFEKNAEIILSDYVHQLGQIQADNVVILDPPYKFENWEGLLNSIEADVVVIESDRNVSIMEPWNIIKAKRYGTTMVTIALKPLGKSL
jgi:16S rRNA (guanine966-N2)-methyltransferase